MTKRRRRAVVSSSTTRKMNEDLPESDKNGSEPPLEQQQPPESPGTVVTITPTSPTPHLRTSNAQISPPKVSPHPQQAKSPGAAPSQLSAISDINAGSDPDSDGHSGQTTPAKRGEKGDKDGSTGSLDGRMASSSGVGSSFSERRKGGPKNLTISVSSTTATSTSSLSNSKETKEVAALLVAGAGELTDVAGSKGSGFEGVIPTNSSDLMNKESATNKGGSPTSSIAGGISEVSVQQQSAAAAQIMQLRVTSSPRYNNNNSGVDYILAPLKTARISPSSAKKKSRLRGSDTCPQAETKMHQFFYQWLSMEDTIKAMDVLLSEYKMGSAVYVPTYGDDVFPMGSPPTALSSSGDLSSQPSFASHSSQASLPVKRSNSLGSNPYGFNTIHVPMSPVAKMLSTPFSFASYAETALKSPRMHMVPGWFGEELPVSSTAAVIGSAVGATAGTAASGTSIAATSSAATPGNEKDKLNARADSVIQRVKSRKSISRIRKLKPQEVISQFYFPVQEGIAEHEEMEEEMISEFFDTQPINSDGEKAASRIDLPELLVEAVGMPSFLSGLIFDRIMGVDGLPSDERIKAGSMPESKFREFFDQTCRNTSRPMRLFKILLHKNLGKRKYLIHSDFTPLMESLLEIHPGLSFLETTPEFQQRYAETVVERIFYRLSRHPTGKVYFPEFLRHDFLETLMEVDEEEDINRERKYFSYEHFYVLYCRFWEVDGDHDLLISKDDLAKYGSHSLTFRIIDRLFEGVARPLQSGVKERMSYADFLWFCLCEEDKTNRTSIEYWFRCIDMDGDGIVTIADLEYFYEEQLHRMECLGHESVAFPDILCQLIDMIDPSLKRPHITLKKLLKSPMASGFFNTLFNLNKFFQLESKSAAQSRFERATPDLSDWDRFASVEYQRLSAEAENSNEDEEDEDDESELPADVRVDEFPAHESALETMSRSNATGSRLKDKQHHEHIKFVENVTEEFLAL